MIVVQEDRKQAHVLAGGLEQRVLLRSNLERLVEVGLPRAIHVQELQGLDDLLLERSVREAIHRRCDRCVRGLAIWVDDGIVTLRGQTRSFYEKQLVLHALKQVGGLAGIVDEMSVAAH